MTSVTVIHFSLSLSPIVHPLIFSLCFNYRLFFSNSTACAHRWLFLRFGHQPATWRQSAGDRPHALHWDSRPHDFCDFLCLQWLLCGVCGHQEWSSKEGNCCNLFSWSSEHPSGGRFPFSSLSWCAGIQPVKSPCSIDILRYFYFWGCRNKDEILSSWY